MNRVDEINAAIAKLEAERESAIEFRGGLFPYLQPETLKKLHIKML
jgi:hypothetical protein